MLLVSVVCEYGLVCSWMKNIFILILNHFDFSKFLMNFSYRYIFICVFGYLHVSCVTCVCVYMYTNKFYSLYTVYADKCIDIYFTCTDFDIVWLITIMVICLWLQKKKRAVWCYITSNRCKWVNLSSYSTPPKWVYFSLYFHLKIVWKSRHYNVKICQCHSV